MHATLRPSPTLASKPRPERQRDVLFGAGCGLLCFGLFPFSASGSSVSSDHSGTGDFDAKTQWLSLTFSIVGLACVTLSCVVIPRARLRLALMVLLLPLLAAIGVTCATIFHNSTVDDVVNVLRDTRVVSIEQELRLERGVNELYCRAQARSLCSRGDMELALGIEWPEEKEAVCAQLQQEPVEKVDSDLDPLTLIAEPTTEAIRWCGRYMATTNHEGAEDLTQSPYQQHRVEVLDELMHALAWRQARTKLLMVLEWFATPALIASIWWLRAPTAKVGVAPSTMYVVV